MNDDIYFHDQFIEDEDQQENEEDLFLIQPEQGQQAVVTATDWTTETILNQIDKGNILLNPSFQRRDAWTTKRKSKFIESLILGFPVPQLVLAESHDSRGKYLVLDGKQRLLAIRQFSAKRDDPIYSKLKLAGLEVKKGLNRKSLEDLKSDIQYHGDLTALENQSIRTVIIKNWPNEAFLYHVFLRLNTGSVSLSPQELRQALHPGDFVKFVDEKSRISPALRKILKNKDGDFRMRDAELLVRYYAFSRFLETYKGNLKSFLDYTCKTLNRSWKDTSEDLIGDLKEFESAHSAIEKIFGENAYRKWQNGIYETRFNRAIFDILLYTFRHPDVRRILMEKKEEVEQAYKELFENDLEFLTSVEQTTKSISATYIRISRWCNKINSTFGTDVTYPSI